MSENNGAGSGVKLNRRRLLQGGAVLGASALVTWSGSSGHLVAHAADGDLVLVAAGQAKAQIVVPSINLLTNPGFESPTTLAEPLAGWTQFDSTNAAVRTNTGAQRRFGVAAVRLTTTTTAHSCGLTSHFIDVVAGQAYQAAARFLVPQAGAPEVRLSFYDATSSTPLASVTAAYAAQTPGWNRVAAQGVAPAGATRATITVVLPAGAVGEAFVDDAELGLDDPSLPDAHAIGRSADLLISTIAAITGVTLTTTTAEPAGLAPIYLARPGALTSTSFDATGLETDGFALEITPQSITLAGDGWSGTWMGAVHFTEAVLGVGYCLPGPDGTHVPTQSSVSTAPTSTRQVPSFSDRGMYPYGYSNLYGDPSRIDSADARTVFGTRLRSSMQAKYSHNLAVIFNPAKFATSHPEIYPIRNGVTYVPPANGANANWQPRFQDANGVLVESVVQVAVDYALAELRMPDSTGWVAMGINDGLIDSYSQDTPRGLAPDGSVSYSDAYYAWLNEVARRVEAELGHRDFFLGCLAYREVRQAPSFTGLHPSIVPFFTHDLFSWARPELATRDKGIIDRWVSAGITTLGWWDYPWGMTYMIPRLNHKGLQEALKYLHSKGLRSIFGEIDPNLGDGAKSVVYSKLLWDVSADLDQVVARWSRDTAGAGAKHLIAWDKLWNDFGVTTMAKSDNTMLLKGDDFPFAYDTSYLNLVPDSVINKSKQLLDAAAAAATTDAQRNRIKIIARQNNYFEASVLSYDRDQPAPRTPADAVKALRSAVGSWDAKRAYATQRRTLMTEFNADPLVRHIWDGVASGMVWDGTPYKVLWTVGTLMRTQWPNSGRSRPLWVYVENLRTKHANPEIRAWAAELLGVARGNVTNVAKNGDLTGGTFAPFEAEAAPAFGPNNQPRLVTDVVRTPGHGSVRIQGPATAGGFKQRVPVEAGKLLRTSFWFKADPTGPLMGAITNTWLCYDANGALMTPWMRGEAASLQTGAGQWRELTQLRRVPEGAAEVACYMSFLRYLAPEDVLHVTDVTFTQVNP